MIYGHILMRETFKNEAHKPGYCKQFVDYFDRSQDGCFFADMRETYLLRTCRFIYNEGLPVYYVVNKFTFRNPANLSRFLCKTNETAFQSIRSIIINLEADRKAGDAIAQLAKLPNLKHLAVVINNASKYFLNEKEEMIQRAFLFYGEPKDRRLMDCAGVDELLTLRGLELIKVVPNDREVLQEKIPEWFLLEIQSLEDLMRQRCYRPRTEVSA